MITVAEINDIDRLDNVRSGMAFPARQNQRCHHSLILRNGWNNYWEHFGEGLKLRVLFITLGNQDHRHRASGCQTRAHKNGNHARLDQSLWTAGAPSMARSVPIPAATMVTAMRHLRNVQTRLGSD